MCDAVFAGAGKVGMDGSMVNMETMPRPHSGSTRHMQGSNRDPMNRTAYDDYDERPIRPGSSRPVSGRPMHAPPSYGDDDDEVLLGTVAPGGGRTMADMAGAHAAADTRNPWAPQNGATVQCIHNMHAP